MRTAIVCDDDPVIRDVIGRMLVEHGFTVVGEAAAAGDSVSLARQVQPAVVVLDASMPGAIGLETVREIRRVAPTTAVVVCSAFDVSNEGARAAGAVAAVDKTRLDDLGGILDRIDPSSRTEAV